MKDLETMNVTVKNLIHVPKIVFILIFTKTARIHYFADLQLPWGILTIFLASLEDLNIFEHPARRHIFANKVGCECKLDLTQCRRWWSMTSFGDGEGQSAPQGALLVDWH